MKNTIEKIDQLIAGYKADTADGARARLGKRVKASKIAKHKVMTVFSQALYSDDGYFWKKEGDNQIKSVILTPEKAIIILNARWTQDDALGQGYYCTVMSHDAIGYKPVLFFGTSVIFDKEKPLMRLKVMRVYQEEKAKQGELTI